MLTWPFKSDVPKALLFTARATWISALAFLGVVLVGEGFFIWTSLLFQVVFYVALGISALAGLAHRLVHIFEVIKVSRAVPGVVVELCFLLLMALLVSYVEVVAVIGTIRVFFALAHVFRESDIGARITSFLLENPARLVVASFAAVILLGTVLLTFPRATDDGRGAPLLEALFTATSATCVTGLTVIPTARDALVPADVPAFSIFGQWVILGLIQVGGLGIMTLSASALLLAGGRLSVRAQAIFKGVSDEEGVVSLQTMVRHILTVTLVSEGIGAALLVWRFAQDFADDLPYAVFCGIFHAVSAFCNAGFSLFSNSLEQYASDPVVTPVIALLIVLGGLGFMVVTVVVSPATWSKGFRQGLALMPTHCKAVLFTTFWLILGGAFALLLLDSFGAQEGLTLYERIWASFFQSVTARTAGFSVVDMARTARPAVFAYLFLMFVGASPVGTGGGIKTTSLLLILAAVRATLTGREQIEAFGRTFPHRTATKAIAIAALSACWCFVASVLLLMTQDSLATEQVLFEVVSAFGTVGLSLDATRHLDSLGRLVIMLCMFAGRVGPLTLTVALMRKHVSAEVRFPEGRVLVG